MSSGKPEMAASSEARRPKARAIRNAVFHVRNFIDVEVKGSNGASLREARTRTRSQAGTLLGTLASLRDAPLITSETAP